MNPVPRLLGLSLVLLLAFLAAAAGAQAWLRGQDERLRASAIEGKRNQLGAAVALVGQAGTDPLSPAFARELGHLLDGSVALGSAEAAQLPPDEGKLRLEAALPDGRTATVVFAAPAGERLLFLYQRVLLALLLLGVVMVAVVGLILLARSGRTGDAGSKAPWGSTRAEIESLHHLARASVAQGAELAHERGGRQRAEEDAHLRQVMLNHALEEKIRIGRDLHDGLIQSLYATGLTLETARDVASRDPAEAARRIQAGIDLINAGIRDVRNHITGLAPDNVRRQGFADAVNRLTEELRAGRTLELDLRVDDTAASRLDDGQLVQSLLIVREAVSNALRHGEAKRITVRVHAGDGAVGLLIQDDGRGFTPQRLDGTGRGLDNMQARARNAGGTLQLDSTPGRGTRLVLTLPIRQ
ncbi:MAG TPA: sensor histidine kinase [Opitutaceae bacterium]